MKNKKPTTKQYAKTFFGYFLDHAMNCDNEDSIHWCFRNEDIEIIIGINRTGGKVHCSDGEVAVLVNDMMNESDEVSSIYAKIKNRIIGLN
jgi:hypothetical protein